MKHKLKYAAMTVLLLTIGQAAFAGIRSATYEVPTSQSDLKAASIFKLRKLSVTEDIENKTTVKYLVPEELTGVTNEIEFTGALDMNGGNLSSQFGNLNCIANSNVMMCTATYQHLKFNQDLAVQLMTNKYGGEELAKRLSVQEKFSTDPIGIIRIYFKGR